MAQVVDIAEMKQHACYAPMPMLKGFGDMKLRHGIDWPLVSEQIVVRSDLFKLLLRLAIENVPVDQHYYLSLYPDVVQALEKGLFTSARHHYVEFGYLEDRLPFRIEVDNAFYFWAYPDIETEVNSGTISSAQEHFEQHGYKEGREPREGWSLLAG